MTFGQKFSSFLNGTMEECFMTWRGWSRRPSKQNNCTPFCLSLLACELYVPFSSIWGAELKTQDSGGLVSPGPHHNTVVPQGSLRRLSSHKSIGRWLGSKGATVIATMSFQSLDYLASILAHSARAARRARRVHVLRPLTDDRRHVSRACGHCRLT